MCRVGQNHIYGVYTVFLSGKSSNIRSYTVYIYGSGQPYSCAYLYWATFCLRATAFAIWWLQWQMLAWKTSGITCRWWMIPLWFNWNARICSRLGTDACICPQTAFCSQSDEVRRIGFATRAEHRSLLRFVSEKNIPQCFCYNAHWPIIVYLACFHSCDSAAAPFSIDLRSLCPPFVSAA